MRTGVGPIKALMLGGGVVLCATPALAQQEGGPPQPSETQQAEPSPPAAGDIIVTGSRVARDGTQAPTPVTVLNNEKLEALAITSIGEGLQQLPQFRAYSSPAYAVGGSPPGQRLADLRGMGATRTLVLFDGRRFTPTTNQGTVDLNLLPALLAGRTEVVTGGASAAYGADAVAGVLNVIPDTKFTGIKLQAQAGITQQGDGRQISLAVAGGTRFADDRGSIVASFEFADDKSAGDCYSRDWCRKDYGSINQTVAGTGGRPARLITSGVHNSTAAPGGLVTTTLLRGTQFTGGEGTRNYVFGDFVSSTSQIGGSGALEHFLYIQTPITAPIKRYVGYLHADYDLTDDIQLFVAGNYGHLTSATRVRQVDSGSLVIRSDNAFLPESVRDTAASNGIASFRLGRLNEDINPRLINTTEVYQASAGIKGNLGAGWKWDAFVQYGHSELTLTSIRSRISANFARAIDAVFDPANPSQIVCRSTVANPSNGCVPFNIFGSNQYSQAGFDYTHGTGKVSTTVEEISTGANLSGSLFSTWAGPVNVALGAEYRTDKITGSADPLSAAFGFAQGNGQNYSGRVKVAEGYLEAIVPLAKDTWWARNLELNGAIRGTNYNTSGNAVTYKVGVVYEPVDGVRFRATRSRDIRAPNASELFSGTTTALSQIQDTTGPGNPNGSNVFTPIILTQSSNRDLQPEKATTWTAGFVLQPRFAPGFSFSVDYYNIDLKNAIGRLGGQNVLNRCAAGATEFCSLVTRDSSGLLTDVADTYLNFGGVKARGIDFEASYARSLTDLGIEAPGKIGLQVFASHVMDLVTVDSAGSVDRAGQLGLFGSLLASPDWTGDATLSYDSDQVSIALQNRFIGRGRYDVTLIDPKDEGYSIFLPNSVNNNRVPSRFYQNLSVTFRTQSAGGGVKYEFYGVVNNLWDRDPPVAPSSSSPTSPAYYDTIGRAFRVGVRVQY